jgi:UDP-N-acetylglucosamine acyltransferase
MFILAKIAKNVVIEPLRQSNNVVIGDGTWIGSNVTIMEGAIERIAVFFRQQLSLLPQDLKFGGEESLAIIGDNCN